MTKFGETFREQLTKLARGESLPEPEPLTVDEAMEYIANDDYSNRAPHVLAAEVERLRERERFLSYEKVQVGGLRDAAGFLRAQLDFANAENEAYRERMMAAERKLLDYEGKPMLYSGRTALKRFTDREHLIDAIKQATIEELPKAVCELEAWEQEHSR